MIQVECGGVRFQGVLCGILTRCCACVLDVVSDFIFKWICTPSADAWPIKRYDTQTKIVRVRFSLARHAQLQ
jgi:hypothetical protein